GNGSSVSFRIPLVSMKLRELLPGLEYRKVTGDVDAEITGIAYDSRQVSPGDLFVAIRGIQTDGNQFISPAISRGASAIVSAGPAHPEFTTKPWVEVEDERAALAVLAGNFYDHPTGKLHVIGITGTNGKTTTTYLVESILRAAGHQAAVLG